MISDSYRNDGGGFLGASALTAVARPEILTGARRRRTRRFALKLPVTYRSESNVSGAGTTVNISSTGVLFRGPNPPPLNSTVKLAIEWPWLLNGERPLQLVVTGRVVRIGGNDAAVTVDRYEFFTRPRVGSGAEKRSTATVAVSG